MLPCRSYLPFLLTLHSPTPSTTSTLPLHHRDLRHTTTTYTPNGDVLTNFSPDYPTCANDVRLTDCLYPYNDSTVITVRPDCDIVTDYICTAVAAMANRSPGKNTNLTSLTYQYATCSARILFPGGWSPTSITPSSAPLAVPMTYASCAESFHSIMQTCMLLSNATGAGGHYASIGHQAGVRGVFHQFFNPSAGSRWQASTQWGNRAGYMMGVGDMWGPVHAMAAQNIMENGDTNLWGRCLDVRGCGWWHGPNNFSVNGIEGVEVVRTEGECGCKKHVRSRWWHVPGD
ncbi:hypothetical protein ACLMJK_004579 [Lecanora helva]